eukprot:scaffold252607_cov15-Tisochrysis_lutea.AAC.1
MGKATGCYKERAQIAESKSKHLHSDLAWVTALSVIKQGLLVPQPHLGEHECVGTLSALYHPP